MNHLYFWMHKAAAGQYYASTYGLLEKALHHNGYTAQVLMTCAEDTAAYAKEQLRLATVIANEKGV